MKIKKSTLLLFVAALVLASIGVTAVIIGSQSSIPKPLASVSSLPTITLAPVPTVQNPFTKADPTTYTGPGPAIENLGPYNLTVPSVGVDVSYGLTKTTQVNGRETVVVPDNGTAGLVNTTAPLEAAEGSTVFVAHVNTNTNGPGPFAGIHKAQKGAPFSRTDSNLLMAGLMSSSCFVEAACTNTGDGVGVEAENSPQAGTAELAAYVAKLMAAL